jgi:outer membrane protein assembly factor BamB/predicted Ser/Thr protein kinase
MRPLGANDPTAIASYRLLGVLGGGGMGRVYLAESRTGRRVAIKIIRADLAEDPVFRRRFEREVTAARTVSPLYTAAVVDADTAATEPWFATTFIDGPTLSQLVEAEGPLGPGAVLTLAAGLAEALASIHKAGLVHRDLKPGNIILDDTGPHIIDFGIVLTQDTTRLSTSLIVGTPSYVPPEVILGSEAGPPGDVFALGATLSYAASGRHLVTDGPMHAQILQITAGRFDLNAVPKELRALIVRCTSAIANDRPTADELARMLVAGGVARPSPGWYSSKAPAPRIDLSALRSRRLSRRKLLVIGGTVGVAAAGTGAAAWAGVFAGPPNRDAALEPPTLPTSAGASPSRPAAPRPGDIVWHARSGAMPLGQSPSPLQSPTRILVHRGELLITANGSRVFAVRIDGTEKWSRTLATGLVNLWPWGDEVLVSDTQRLWLLDAQTGAQRWVVNAAEAEVRDSRGDNPDGLAVEIGGVALAADTAFVGLGTATIALNRSGRQLWRRARPDPRNGVRPPAGVPVATSGRWLVTHDPSGSVVDLGLRDVSDGHLRWLEQYKPAAPAPSGQPPPKPGGPSGSPGGPGGPPGPPLDEAWSRSEGRIGRSHVVIREVQEVRVVALSDGTTIWPPKVSQTPVAGMDLVGDTVLVAADRLRAYAIATGAQVWQADLRGARVVVAPNRRSVIVAAEQGLAALRPDGFELWQRLYPDTVRDTVMHRITVEGDLAYVTFRPKGEQRDPLDVDVIAVALGPQA